jgi:hypothetical protein
MEKESFIPLIDNLKPIYFNKKMSRRSTDQTGIIGLEIILHYTLHYLAGSSGDNIRNVCVISEALRTQTNSINYKLIKCV